MRGTENEQSFSLTRPNPPCSGTWRAAVPSSTSNCPPPKSKGSPAPSGTRSSWPRGWTCCSWPGRRRAPRRWRTSSAGGTPWDEAALCRRIARRPLLRRLRGECGGVTWFGGWWWRSRLGSVGGTRRLEVEVGAPSGAILQAQITGEQIRHAAHGSIAAAHKSTASAHRRVTSP
jgi:hypothetical protein